jgi:hypothetical protein
MGGSWPHNQSNNQSDKHQVLNLLRLPGLVDPLTTSYLLGVPEHAVRILVRHGVLKPLGRRDGAFRQYFSSALLVQMVNDPRAMDKVATVLQTHWREAEAKKNGQKQ